MPTTVVHIAPDLMFAGAPGQAPEEVLPAMGDVAPVPVLEVYDARRGRLRIDRGERVCLLGGSGAGKTQWLRSMVGIGEPFDVIRLWGNPASRELVAAMVGWVPDGDGVMLSGTVLENVSMSVAGRGVHRSRAVDVLDQIGLAGRATDQVSLLNRAERRRVSYARTLARRARLVLIDGELDAVLWAHVPMLMEYQPWIEAVLVTQARITAFTRRSSSVVLLHEGAVVAQGPLEGLAGSSDPDVHGILMGLGLEDDE
jgi:ABC-type multidrug transport system ATPase subunit